MSQSLRIAFLGNCFVSAIAAFLAAIHFRRSFGAASRATGRVRGCGDSIFVDGSLRLLSLTGHAMMGHALADRLLELRIV